MLSFKGTQVFVSLFVVLLWGVPKYSLGQKPHQGFPGGSEVKASAWNAGDPGLIPGWGRSSGEGNGNSLQDPCLENSTDGGALWAMVHGVTKVGHAERLHLTSLLDKHYEFIFSCFPFPLFKVNFIGI